MLRLTAACVKFWSLYSLCLSRYTFPLPLTTSLPPFHTLFPLFTISSNVACHWKCCLATIASCVKCFYLDFCCYCCCCCCCSSSRCCSCSRCWCRCCWCCYCRRWHLFTLLKNLLEIFLKEPAREQRKAICVITSVRSVRFSGLADPKCKQQRERKSVSDREGA